MCSFLPCLSWLLRSRVRKSRRDLWITLYIPPALSLQFTRACREHNFFKWAYIFIFLVFEVIVLCLLKSIRVARTSLYSNSSSKILQFKTAITLLALSFVRRKQQSKKTDGTAVLGMSNTTQETLYICSLKYEQSTKNWQNLSLHTNRVESSPIQSSQTLESRGVHTDRVESNQVYAISSGILVLFELWTIKEFKSDGMF